MTASTTPDLFLSRLDCERIEALLELPGSAAIDTSALEAELARAQIVEPAQMPADVITMNSTAEVLDLDSGELLTFTVVFPRALERDADGQPDKVSILAPVGSALLGLRIGDSIEWPVPGGRTIRLQVLSIRFQPEAAGELHR